MNVAEDPHERKSYFILFQETKDAQAKTNLCNSENISILRQKMHVHMAVFLHVLKNVYHCLFLFISAASKIVSILLRVVLERIIEMTENIKFCRKETTTRIE